MLNNKKKDKKKKNNDANTERKDPSTILLDEAKFSELSVQQKIWVVAKVILYASSPFILYMCIPAVVIAVGTYLYKGTIFGLDEGYLVSASNFYTFIGIITVLIVLKKLAKKRGTTLSEEISFSFRNINWKYLFLMYLFGFLASFCVSSVYTLLPDFLMGRYDELSGAIYTGYDMILVMASLALLDPIAEEIVFRGYMLNRLLPPLKEKKSIIIVSAIFALCHLSVFWMIYSFVMGVVLAKISIRHDNIAYSISMHMGFNVFKVIIYYISLNEKLNSLLFGNKLIIFMYAIITGGLLYFLVKTYSKLENLGLNLDIRRIFNRKVK